MKVLTIIAIFVCSVYWPARAQSSQESVNEELAEAIQIPDRGEKFKKLEAILTAEFEAEELDKDRAPIRFGSKVPGSLFFDMVYRFVAANRSLMAKRAANCAVDNLKFLTSEALPESYELDVIQLMAQAHVLSFAEDYPGVVREYFDVRNVAASDTPKNTRAEIVRFVKCVRAEHDSLEIIRLELEFLNASKDRILQGAVVYDLYYNLNATRNHLYEDAIQLIVLKTSELAATTPLLWYLYEDDPALCNANRKTALEVLRIGALSGRVESLKRLQSLMNEADFSATQSALLLEGLHPWLLDRVKE